MSAISPICVPDDLATLSAEAYRFVLRMVRKLEAIHARPCWSRRARDEMQDQLIEFVRETRAYLYELDELAQTASARVHAMRLPIIELVQRVSELAKALNAIPFQRAEPKCIEWESEWRPIRI